jgi:3-methyl-2-oxobutanoate hydroxymethyltransferase
MSTHPQPKQPAGDGRAPITLPRLAEMKANGEPIVMVTAYDYPSALVAEEAGVDIVLVGDTAAMVVLGYDATTPVGMDEMTTMAAAVRRGLKTPLLIGDMPFGSYERSNEHAIENAQRFVREAGVDAVKLERGGPSVERARAIAGSGIPVMGHVGLTPQSASALGGFKAQGKTVESAKQIAHDVYDLQAAGCFAMVFEAVPAAVADALMPHIHVPVIGIGAGLFTDGQVLVFHDLLGMTASHVPKFVKRYAEIHDQMVAGVRAYAEDVRSHRFPDADHVYSVDPDAVAELRAYLDQGSLATSPWDW